MAREDAFQSLAARWPRPWGRPSWAATSGSGGWHHRASRRDPMALGMSSKDNWSLLSQSLAQSPGVRKSSRRSPGRPRRRGGAGGGGGAAAGSAPGAAAAQRPAGAKRSPRPGGIPRVVAQESRGGAARAGAGAARAAAAAARAAAAPPHPLRRAEVPGGRRRGRRRSTRWRGAGPRVLLRRDLTALPHFLELGSAVLEPDFDLCGKGT